MKAQPITQLRPLQLATIVAIKLHSSEQTRLSQLGLRCGTTIKILQSSKDSPLLLALGTSRMGLNYQMAQSIYVNA